MYELAKSSREAMKSKARRLAGEKDSKVDSSNWSPAKPLNTEKKTGLQPISRKCGGRTVGKVEGAATAFRADRKPRKAGGRVEGEKKEAKVEADAMVNRDVKKANAKIAGKPHDGGMKCGGRAKKNLGGVMEVLSPAYGMARALQRGGKDDERDAAEQAKGMAMANAMRKSGGKVKKARGGSLPSPEEAMESEVRTKGIRATDTKMPRPEEAAERSGKTPQDMPGRKSGGRTARATGGRAKGKGKTNISINILAGGKAPAADMGAMPPAPPPSMPIPTPAPPPAAPPPAMMPMPMGGGQPPMGRKRGGRVYSSYKDMDAGAASGDGRLEKTEIQQKKRRA